MKKALFLCVIIPLVLFSCDKKGEGIKTAASGKINSVTVLIDDNLWNGAIGDSLRNKLASPVIGLPQEEPLFTINQYPVKLLEGYVTDNRNIIVIKKYDNNPQFSTNARSYFKIEENQYTKPQTIVYISGKTTAEILNMIEEHTSEIISKMRAAEIIQNQQQLAASAINVDRVIKKFGISLSVPSGYRYALQRKKFIWFKKEITSGNCSVVIYEVPLSAIRTKGDIVSSIIRARDSIGKRYIHGTRPHTDMVTENSYTPYFSTVSISGKTAYETRGTWELNDDFMSGPFINYCIADPPNKRYVILEGFCYAPSREKRDLMFEMEAMMKSLRFVKKK